ncbi:hypothetical protein KFU94_01675 [Chloroflexi bacterium TSY]|nr:hypothetical protein [Chloroflexi bacterium TSY]
MNWRLRPDPETGIAFVYARFRDAAGNVSDHIESAGIRYEPTDPQNTDDETRAGGTLGELPTNLPYRSFLPFVAK